MERFEGRSESFTAKNEGSQNEEADEMDWLKKRLGMVLQGVGRNGEAAREKLVSRTC